MPGLIGDYTSMSGSVIISVSDLGLPWYHTWVSSEKLHVALRNESIKGINILVLSDLVDPWLKYFQGQSLPPPPPTAIGFPSVCSENCGVILYFLGPGDIFIALTLATASINHTVYVQFMFMDACGSTIILTPADTIWKASWNSIDEPKNKNERMVRPGLWRDQKLGWDVESCIYQQAFLWACTCFWV